MALTVALTVAHSEPRVQACTGPSVSDSEPAAFAKQTDDNIVARFKSHQVTEAELSEFCKDMTGRTLNDLPVSIKKNILDIYVQKIVLEEAAKADSALYRVFVYKNLILSNG